MPTFHEPTAAQKACQELTEALVNILWYVRSSLESYALLLMQGHGRDFFEQKSCHGNGVAVAMSWCLCSPRLLCTAVREDTQAPLRATAKAIWLICIHSIRKNTGLKSGVPYPPLPKISALKVYEHKTLKVSLHLCTCYLAPPNFCLRSSMEQYSL